MILFGMSLGDRTIEAGDLGKKGGKEVMLKEKRMGVIREAV